MKTQTLSTTASSMVLTCLLIFTCSVLVNAQEGTTATSEEGQLAVVGRSTRSLPITPTSQMQVSGKVAQSARRDNGSVGELHNEGVRYVLRNFTKGPKRDDDKSIIIALTKDYLRSIGHSASDINIPDGLTSYDQAIGLIEDIKASKTLKDAFKSLINLSRKNPTLSDLNRGLTRLERETAPRLSGEEFKRFSDTVSLVRSSAKFWAPTKQGGENGSRYVKSNGGVDETPSELPVWGWDCVGFLIGGLGGTIACSALAAI